MKNTNASHWLRSIHHDGSAVYISDPYPALGDTVTLRLRAAPGAPLLRVLLRTLPDGEQMLTPMKRMTSGPAAEWWSTSLVIREPVVHYRFILETDSDVYHYSAVGCSVAVPLDATDFRILSDYHPPGWALASVFYQIFIDRFANGDPKLTPQPNGSDPRRNPQPVEWAASPPEGSFFPMVFYGGDLPGIIKRLDYLTDLGVNALYLNPIFTAPSNHKYDVTDYEQVDPHFGGNEALLELRRQLTARNMRYILDIVPNHCGVEHSWFKAAQANPAAPEVEMFTFGEHPDDYATWLGVRTLPKLNYRSTELRKRMYADHHSVIRNWLRPPYSADGWRVDVANMLARQGPSQLGVEISRALREAVKKVRPDAYLLGENFFDASAQLQGDQWDGVMNYSGFTHPLWFWIAGYRQGAHGLSEPVRGRHWPTSAMVSTWRHHMAAIPWAIALQQYNILDSHDTPRIRSIVGGNDALHRLAVVVQMTFPGIPGLYYGDEIGLEDTPDLHQRGCMVWDRNQWNEPLREFHQTLIRLRRESEALQSGGFQVLLGAEDTICYQRETVTERILVVAYRAAETLVDLAVPAILGGIPDGTRFRELFSLEEAVVANGSLVLHDVAQGATIWQQID